MNAWHGIIVTLALAAATAIANAAIVWWRTSRNDSDLKDLSATVTEKSEIIARLQQKIEDLERRVEFLERRTR